MARLGNYVPAHLVRRQFKSAWFKPGAAVRITSRSSPRLGQTGRIEKIVATTRAVVAFPDLPSASFSRNSLRPTRSPAMALEKMEKR